ncbi:MAG: dTDP-4-dehydrorhamnose reductase [Dysgonamonadaceae bacterium]|jgi:dTDP-4-dehydrorhamnose reductase|nr:dTDP-4-dehydrorhamnose reductase [Dysgonamonadaceae bacterium]
MTVVRKNILVAGANGQLGNELQLLFDHYPGFEFFPADVDVLDLTDQTKTKAFVAKNRIDYIVNCAAYTAVDKAEDEPERCYEINKDAVAYLAEAARGKAKIIHISTDYVFDGTNTIPYKETDQTNPPSVYGKSKKEGEEILFSIHPESIVIRTAWLYSSFGNNFVRTMIRLGNEKTELNVVADQKGTPTCAADLAKAILDIIVHAEENKTFPAGIYHYSNEGETTWYGFAKEIFRLTGINCRINPIATAQYPTKASRPMYSVLDKTKIKQTFRIDIANWEDSLKKCIDKSIKTN